MNSKHILLFRIMIVCVKLTIAMEQDEQYIPYGPASYQSTYNQPYRVSLKDFVQRLDIMHGGVKFYADPNDPTQDTSEQYTYFTAGFMPFDFASNFFNYRNNKSKQLQFPKNYVVVNGPVNKKNGTKHGLSTIEEAKRHLKIITALYKAGCPVTTWQTICYGFFGLQATVFCLAS